MLAYSVYRVLDGGWLRLPSGTEVEVKFNDYVLVMPGRGMKVNHHFYGCVASYDEVLLSGGFSYVGDMYINEYTATVKTYLLNREENTYEGAMARVEERIAQSIRVSKA